MTEVERFLMVWVLVHEGCGWYKLVYAYKLIKIIYGGRENIL